MIAAPDSSEQGPETAAAGLHTFMRLPSLQRSAVILKDVLGHSLEEIASITGASEYAAKSALQRGRVRLRELAAEPEGASTVFGVPHISPECLRLSGGYIGAKRMLWFMAHSVVAVAYDTMCRREGLVSPLVEDIADVRDGSGSSLIRRSKTDRRCVFVAADDAAGQSLD